MQCCDALRRNERCFLVAPSTGTREGITQRTLGDAAWDEKERVETRGVAMHCGATNVVLWWPRRPAPGRASRRGRWGTRRGMRKRRLRHGMWRCTSAQRTSFSGGLVDRHAGGHHAEDAGNAAGEKMDLRSRSMARCDPR